MSAESPSPGVETLSVTLKFPDVNTFAERFAGFLERRRILLPGVAARPQGTAIRFQLKLKDGTTLIAGEGHVETMVAAGAIPGCPPGMVLQFEADPATVPLCNRILGARGDAPSPMLPPAIELPRRAPSPPAVAEPPAAEPPPVPASPEPGPPHPAQHSTTATMNLRCICTLLGNGVVTLSTDARARPMLPRKSPGERISLYGTRSATFTCTMRPA